MKLMNRGQHGSARASGEGAAQILAAFRLNGVGKPGASELFADLIIKISAIGDNHKRGVFGFRHTTKFSREEHHR